MQSKTDLEIVKKTIKNEKNGLNSLLKLVDHSVSEAIDLIYKTSGKIILAGIGKSGHIAQKISATLSSTGTHSHYINCSEANHGDLGIIKKDDLIIALSKSGETLEMGGIINYCKKNKIKIIAITSNQDSFLSQNANRVCLIPDLPEACLLNLAPTTSTTMMLALGDSIAMALMARNKFKQVNFKELHPGGMLGQSLLEVKSLMHSKNEIPLVSEKANMRQALLEITSKRFGCVGIVNEKKSLTGIITDGDLRRNIKKDFLEYAVKRIMTKNPIIIDETSSIYDAIILMNKFKITALFVANKKNRIPRGILHIHDCIKVGTNKN